MKKTIGALLLCLVLVVIMAVPVMATPGKAQGSVKVNLYTAVWDGINPNLKNYVPSDTVVGSIIINTTANGKLNVLINIDNQPNLEDYDVRIIILEWDPKPPIADPPNPPIFKDILKTNAQGHGNAQITRAIPTTAMGDMITVQVRIAEQLPSPTGPAFLTRPATVPLK
jgi:hypothetical protein